MVNGQYINLLKFEWKICFLCSAHSTELMSTEKLVCCYFVLHKLCAMCRRVCSIVEGVQFGSVAPSAQRTYVISTGQGEQYRTTKQLRGGGGGC